MAKKDRCDYFGKLQSFIEELGAISDRLRVLSIPERNPALKVELANINKLLSQTPGLYIPLVNASSQHCCVVNIPPEESVLLNSRDRAPYLIIAEVLESPVQAASEQLHEYVKEYQTVFQLAPKPLPVRTQNSTDSIQIVFSPESGSGTDEGAFKPVVQKKRSTRNGIEEESEDSNSSSQPQSIATSQVRPKYDPKDAKLKGSSDKLKGSSDIPKGSGDIPKGSTDKLKVSSDIPKGSTDKLKGSTEIPKGAMEKLKGSNEALKVSTDKVKTSSDGRKTEKEEIGKSSRGQSREPRSTTLEADKGKKSREPSTSNRKLGYDAWVVLESPEKQQGNEEKRGRSILYQREKWEEKVQRIRKTSKFGHLPNWKLQSIIVKYGDDCRQERMALQLINQFYRIITGAKLPLYLRPYNILVLAPECCLIETVTNAMSIHQLKKEYNGVTIAEYFKQRCKGTDTQEYKICQANFIESTAAYSLVTYLLQLKDRHNGNILINNDGYIIHIDFGFMLSNSPGSLNFETSPFKLTQEYLEFMDGVDSAKFTYFKVLLTTGFLEFRKHSDKIIGLVEMMMQTATKLPCFVGGPRVLDELKERFVLSLTDRQIEDHVEALLKESVNNWRTMKYDQYQYLTNGILA
uniref:1-phosphatidylinositol 4-kinase n=1 Tax=Arcella intermedia TaxID=1963864 RepID=A0A6B2KZI4_9EUKA